MSAMSVMFVLQFKCCSSVLTQPWRTFQLLDEHISTLRWVSLYTCAMHYVCYYLSKNGVEISCKSVNSDTVLRSIRYDQMNCRRRV